MWIMRGKPFDINEESKKDPQTLFYWKLATNLIDQVIDVVKPTNNKTQLFHFIFLWFQTKKKDFPKKANKEKSFENQHKNQGK